MGGAASAAVITWVDQGTITSKEVIQPDVSSAFNLFNQNVTTSVTTATQTVQFVSTSSGSITSNGVTLALTGFNNAGIQTLGNVWNGDNTDAGFNTVMNSFAHGPGVPTSNTTPRFITLSGLTPGEVYSVQVFASDMRANIGNVRTIQFADTSGNATAEVLQNQGQYFTGTFIADATTQRIDVFSGPFPGPDGNGSVILNALTLSVIPEPSAGLLMGLGALFLAARRRR